jgi:Amt family ammonium transporter
VCPQLSWSAVEWLLFGRPSTLGLISGAVAGLVGITPASGTAGALGALCIGAVTGAATLLASTKLKEKLDVYDDALDAFGLHAVGGVVGALLTGVWCAPALGGVGFGTLIRKGGGRDTRIGNIGFQLGVQAASVALAICWVTLGTLLTLKLTDLAHGGRHWGLRLRAIRVSDDAERIGLDEAQFAEQARWRPMSVAPMRIAFFIQFSGNGAHVLTTAWLFAARIALPAGLQLPALRHAHLRRGA